MKSLKLSFALILLALAWSLSAASLLANGSPSPEPKVNASQPPIPSRRELGTPQKTQTSKEKNNPAPDQRGTEQTPIIVKITPTPKTQADADAANEEKQEKAAAQNRAETLTAITAGATFIQALALIITIAVMVRTARRQLRAYMTIKHAGILLIPQSDDDKKDGHRSIVVDITIQNSGQTPAYKTNAWFKIQLLDLPADSASLDTTPAPRDQWSSAVVGASETLSMGTKGPVTMNTENFNAVRAQKKGIFVWGVVTYRDIFKKERITNFRMMNGSFTHAGDGGAWALAPTEEDNEAT